MRKGEFVVVSVTDTGSGMPPDVVARAFEPFFTTKPTGRGTGLGLSTIYGFASQTGGHVTLYSEVGRGTTVSLYLPRASDVEGELCAATPDEQEVLLSENSETILVVEDNPEVREVTLQRVEALGYVVLEAASGPEAIELLTRSRDVRLVFSDVVMPGGMSGYDLATWLQDHRPDLPIVLTSGFSATSGLVDLPLAAHSILHKPYSRVELSQVLHAALNKANRSAPKAV
jgi:CheY-like chemotaxis protein